MNSSYIRLLDAAGLGAAALLALSGCASTPESAPAGAAEELAVLLAGEYNNHTQRWQATRAEEPEPAALSVVIQRLPDIAATGVAALMYRQYGDGGELYREARLLLENTPEGVRQEVQARRDGDWRTLEGCRVYWRRSESGFQGETRGDGCRFGQRDGGEVVVFQRRWRATPDRLELEETTRRLDGTETRPYHFARLRYFTGWAGVLARGPASESDEDWRVDRDLRLHDGGDSARIAGAGPGPSPYAVRLERLVWPRSGISMLRLSVIEAESGALIAYSWAEPGSSRIGINLGWLQAGLAADAEQRPSGRR